MLRLAIALLAKKPLPKRGRGAPAQRRTAKPPIRRPSSRSASPKRKATSSSLLKKSTFTPAVPGAEPAVSPPTSTAESSVTLPSPNASVALPSPVNVRPPCCLATAVSTVIVPPLANAMLEGMKQILSPMVRRPNDGGVNSSSGAGEDGKEPISQMEEFYTSKKGPLFATAVIAGTNAVKQASQIIPFCHPMRIQKCSFTFRRRVVAGINRTSPLPHRIVLRKRTSPPPPPSRARGECSVLYCFCTVSTDDSRTGVEMEAMTGANVAALTLYDMLKSLPGSQEDGLGISESFVLAKRGGKTDFTKLLMSETEPPPPSREELAGLLPQGQVVLEDGVDEKIPQATSSLGPTGSVEEVRGGNDDVHEEEEKDKDDEKRQQHRHKEEEEEAEEGEEEETTSVEAVPPPAEAPKRPERIEKSVEKSMEKQPNKVEAKVKPTSEKRDKTEQQSERTKGTTESMAGDTHAWWKSTPREKRLQQMHPRQRFDVNSQRTIPRVVAKKTNPKRTPPKGKNVKRGETSKSRASPASAVKKKNTTTKESAAARTVVRRRPSVYEPPEEQSDDDEEEEEEQQEQEEEEEEETEVQAEENVDEWVGDGDDEPEDEYRKEIDTGRGKQSAGGRGRKPPRRKTTNGDHYRKSVAAGARDIEEFEDEEGEGEREEKVVGKNLPPARGGRGKQRKSSPPARHNSSGSSGSRRRSREESDSDEIAVAVNHDTWDSVTQVEAEDDQEANDARDYTEEEDEGGEEIPPPSRKKGKNPKASSPRRRSSR